MLNLDFTTGGTRAGAGGFVPGTAVDLSVTATSDKAKKIPAPAILYAAIVNSAVASDPKDRLLTTHFLIAGEVNTPDALEYADFLLSDHPKAAETLDLVLGTQGWRRFAEQDPASERVLLTADKILAGGDEQLSAEEKAMRERGLHFVGPCVTVFGSARTLPDAAAYKQAILLGKTFAEKDWLVITGAASGIMEAGHVGAGRENSMGLNIMLPFEQSSNPIIAGDPNGSL
jgi:hypothetical protein